MRTWLTDSTRMHGQQHTPRWFKDDCYKEAEMKFQQLKYFNHLTNDTEVNFSESALTGTQQTTTAGTSAPSRLGVETTRSATAVTALKKHSTSSAHAHTARQHLVNTVQLLWRLPAAPCLLHACELPAVWLHPTAYCRAPACAKQ